LIENNYFGAKQAGKNLSVLHLSVYDNAGKVLLKRKQFKNFGRHYGN